MKRKFINQIVLIAAFALAPLFAHAYVFEADGIYYNITSLSDLTVEVTYETTSYDSYSGKIAIPDTVTYNGKTYAVTSIGSSAFRNCTSLKSVTIGDAVTSIGSYAFRNCSSLKSVTIPDAVTTIGNYAFYYCTSLASVTIGDAVTTIRSSAFSYCSHLTNIICSGTVPPTCASTNCFSNYDATLHVPTDAVETYASTSVWKKFATILGYTELPIFEDDGINYIITSHEDLEVEVSAGDYTGEITVPETVTYSGKTYAVTSIGEYAFYNCSSLTSVTIGDAVTTIGSSAFRECNSLKSVTIGDAVISIGNYAFYYCSSLKSVTIPDAVTTIGNYAFYNCSILTSVSIGENVTGIGNAAFYGCDSLENIYSLNSTPAKCASRYCFSNYDATLHVTANAVSTYASTSVWKEFNNIVGDMETYYVLSHRPVYEEYTGMWCGYCPRGAVWMAIMKDSYPEDWIGISYHYNDDLQMLNKSDFPLSVNSYPSGYFDRQGSSYTSGLSSQWLSRCSIGTPASIEVEASIDADYENIICTAKLIFMEDVDGDDYEVEFILVADSLHNDSWYQKNYYSSSSVSSYEEYWQVYLEGGSEVYGLFFNDVVIATSRITSTGNISLPSSNIAAMDTMSVAYTQPISMITTLESDMGGSIQNLKEVALLINRTSEQVMNAHQTHVQLENETSGISRLSYHPATGWVAYGEKGRIVIIARETTRFAIHSMGGQLLTRASAASGEVLTISAPPGIYLVNGQKVLVR